MPSRAIPLTTWRDFSASSLKDELSSGFDTLKASLEESMRPLEVPDISTVTSSLPSLPDLGSLTAGWGSPEPQASQQQPSSGLTLPDFGSLTRGWTDQTPARTSTAPPAVSGTPTAMPQASVASAGGPSPVASAGTRASRFANEIAQVSREEGVPEDALAAILDTEDSDENSVSPAGAAGLMQVVPGQGYDLPGEDARDPLTSIRQGARALKDKYNITGSWDEAGAAYFGYGTDAGGMDTNTYRGRYQQNRARYQGAIPGPQPTTPMPAEDVPAAQQQALQGITPEQFGLGDADAEAICGPVLAMAFARSNGRNPTIAEAKQMAAQNGGWTSAQGMGGPEAMANTLRSMGIAATYKPGALDVETIRRETQNGNPVGINTAGHYYVVEAVDEQGRLDLGNSAKALRASGGRQWFRPEEIESLGMGAPTGAIYKDSPNSPTPSVAATAPNAGDASAPATPPQAVAGVPPSVTATTTAQIGAGPESAQPAMLKEFNDEYDPRDADSGPRESGYVLPPAPETLPGDGGVAPQPAPSSLAALPEDEELAPRSLDERPVYGPAEVPATPAIGAVQNARAGLGIEDQPADTSGRRYFEPTEKERQRFDDAVAQMTRPIQPGNTIPFTSTPIPDAARPALGFGLGALQVLSTASDYVSGRLDNIQVPALARSGIVETDLSGEDRERARYLLALSAEGDRQGVEMMTPEERQELSELVGWVEQRYQQIKDSPDQITEYAQSAPGSILIPLALGLVTSQTVGPLASRVAGNAARAAGAGARTARATGYAADVAAQSAIDPTNVVGQPVADALGQGVKSTFRAGQAIPDAVGSAVRRGGELLEQGRATARELNAQPQGAGTYGTTGIAPSASLVSDAANSLGGSVFGAAAGAAMPAETDEERRANALTGAGLGLVGGPVAGRVARRGGGALATFGVSPNYKPPTPAAVQAAERQPAARGARLNQTVTAPPSVVPARVRLATRTTDDLAAVRWAEDMLTDAAGTPRLAENDPARASTQSRVNSGSIANTRVTEELEPGVIAAAKAGLQDELPQHLEDMQARDILDDFYRRGYDEAKEKAQPGLDAMKARGASPAQIQAAEQRIEAAAHRRGEAVMRRRQGGDPSMTYEAIDARLQAQEQRLTADGRWQQLQESAQAVWDSTRNTLDRLVDAGEEDAARAADLKQRYPHYVPTVPISHLDGGAGSSAVASATGPTVSRGNKPVVRALEDVGTSGERLNPIVAARNQIVTAERAIQRNNVARAFAQMMDDALQASPGTMGVDPATHRTFLGGGKDITYFEGGKPVTISVPAAVADGLNAAAEMGADPGTIGRVWKTMMGVVTSAMTAGRASFLPVNLLRDVQDYALRTSSHEGLPFTDRGGVMGTWFQEAGKAAADIARAQLTTRGAVGAVTGFAGGASIGDENTTIGERLRHGVEGAVAGTFLLGANKVRSTGKAAEYIARGGGSGGVSSRWQVGQRWYREVMRDGGATIRTPQDAARYLGDWLQDIATLQGVKGINERTELISRTAAMRRGDKQGLDATEAMIRGRDASYDPDRAGTVARMVNGIVPFFNASVQGGAQTARLFRQNPVAATASIAATVAPVMLGVEAWNRSDPERAQVYDDVPQYIKDSGMVVVMPWAGSDARGYRPNYLWIPTGMTTPFVVGMRTAMEHLPGLEPTAGRVGSRSDAGTVERWADTLATVATIFSPIRGESPASAASALVPQGAKQVLELGLNKDLYRGNQITSDAADERASAASRKVAEGANWLGRTIGNDALQEVRPSGVEHLVRSLPAYGDIVTGASDMVAPSGYKQAEDRPVQNEPFLGGIGGRFIRDTGGANLQRAQDERIPEVARAILEEAGMRPSDVVPVASSYKGATLTRDEQERWQAMTNTLMARELATARRDEKWRNPATREEAVSAAMTRAKNAAAERALRNLTEREIERRQRIDQSRRAAS